MTLAVFQVRRRIHFAAIAALLTACFAAPCARAGLFSDDEARQAILDLREQRSKDQAAMMALTEQVSRLSRSLLDTNNQLEVMRAEVARLRGQTEVIVKDQADIQIRQKDLQSGLNERFSKLEPKEVTLDGKSFKAMPEEVALFDKAYGLLRGADFAGALRQFDALLSQYPRTGYLESILYWQGNAQYGLGTCKPAMETFGKLLAINPQHLRAPEAMLSIANCHVELKESTQGRQLLQTLVKTYPDSEAAQVARERLAPPPPPAAAAPAPSKPQ